MKHGRLLLGLLWLCPPLSAQKYPRFEAWHGQSEPWVRVGLKRPEKVIELFSKGTLLVLDGDKVVDRIDPGGKFYVIVSGSTSNATRYWVQIQASRTEASLVREKERLLQKYPDYSFSIKSTHNQLKALRVGVFKSKGQAESARAVMKAEGFHDAFLFQRKPNTGFHWVDADFDKHGLHAKKPALVRISPDLPIQYAGNGYRGILRLERVNGRIRVINELPLETYLRGVVPSELGPKVYPELEALKAQAVAARTYVLKNLGRFGRKGYDICDGPACQAYDGTSNEDPMSDEAVRSTRGLVLYYGDELIDALYTSTCGGQTEDVENVFPGRSEPYLRGKTSYLANYQSWTLPARPIPGQSLAGLEEEWAVQALFRGFKTLPDLRGDLDSATLQSYFDTLSWMLGRSGPLNRSSAMSYREFWTAIAALDFFKDAVNHQIQPEDEKLLRPAVPVPDDLSRFAGFLIRHDLARSRDLATLSLQQPIKRVRALRYLLRFCKVLGPETEWRTYRMENLAGSRLQVSRKERTREIDLNGIAYYLAEVGGSLAFLSQPVLQELDRVDVSGSPFAKSLLLLRRAGDVASVDRFSAFDSWMEKTDVVKLEKRARRYVPGLRGIRDIRILERSDTGRVTRLEYISDAGSFKVKGLNIRWSLGIRDNLFDMLPSYLDGRLVHLTIVGRGWGHGVGMSQVGAYGLARMGWTYDKILEHYYTGIEIAPFRALRSGNP